MKKTTTVVAAVMAGAAIALAAPAVIAHADAADDNALVISARVWPSLRDLTSSELISEGHATCTAYANGYTDHEVATMIASDTGTTTLAGAYFSGVAAAVYCPSYKGVNS
jgi:hypothetical protein